MKKSKKKGVYNYICIHVDDIFVFSNDKIEQASFKKRLSEEFEVIDLGELSYFLGVSLKRDRKKGIVKLCQEQYVDKLI